VERNGSREWWQGGRRHREGDNPAIEYEGGDKVWYVNGRRHREGGKPAVERVSGLNEWWEDGYLKDIAENPISYPRKTPHEDIIYREVPKSGVKYLLCSLKEEHVLGYEVMTEFSKTQNLKTIRCPYCRSPVLETVFVQP
jgi:hypothetical protein